MIEDLNSLASRVSTLERECRRWRWFGGLLTIVVAIGASLAASRVGPDVVTGEKFVLLDPQGQERIVMEVVEGEPDITLQDSEGKPLLSLDAFEGNPSIRVFRGKDSDYAIEIGVNKAGDPHLLMYDDKERSRVQMGVLTSGKPSFRLMNDTKKPIFTAP